MASATPIPRFLLPQSGAIWRQLRAPNRNRTGLVAIRFSSNTGPDPKTIVLEKPERFNPPSHGARLPKRSAPRHYGGDLSASETQAQRTKDYPGMMAPKGTWSHWVWHSYWLHTVIALGTLGGLAVFTFTQSFKRTSPFADMLPSSSDFMKQPINSFRQLVHVLRLTEMRKAEEIQEKRALKAEDVAKRTAYRRAHGLPVEQGLPWTRSSASQADTKSPAQEQAEVTVEGGAVTVESEGSGKKKWLGIF